MPPLDPEELDEVSSEDEIPARAPQPAEASGLAEDTAMADDDDHEGKEDEADEEYVVEKILTHQIKKGVIRYRVKWLGWEDEEDLTWEPEDNLENAMDIVEAYWKAHGGRPTTSVKAKKRKASTAAEDTPKSAGKSRKRTREDDDQEITPPKIRKMPAGSWENNIATIETLEQYPDPSSGENKLFCFVLWTGDEQPVRTKHDVATIRRKCPQKLIEFFIHRLVFRDEADPQQNGSNAADVAEV